MKKVIWILKMFKKYRNKESGEIIEAKKSINESGFVEYCIYEESSSEKIWGQDLLEKDFLKQYEPIKE